MTIEELREGLTHVLAEEERPGTDWTAVEALCLALIARLNSGEEPEYPHDIVYHFLDDPDIRRKDAVYASRQRQRLREWLVRG